MEELDVNRHPDCANKVSEQVCLDREPKDPWAISSALLCSWVDLDTKMKSQGGRA